MRKLSPTVDPQTRNGIAYVDLPADSGMTAGMYVTGRFVLKAREAMTLPETAIVLRDGNRYLMRIGAQSLVRQVKVTTGRRRDGAVEILDGIETSDRFVKAGGAFLADGDRVDIVTPRGGS